MCLHVCVHVCLHVCVHVHLQVNKTTAVISTHKKTCQEQVKGHTETEVILEEELHSDGVHVFLILSC